MPGVRPAAAGPARSPRPGVGVLLARAPSVYEPIPGLDSGPGAPPARVPWLQPFPDELMARVAADDDPDREVVGRETLELVLLTAIQHLPPKQRAALILRDYLGYSAAQTAEVLDMSVDGVRSALARARPTMREHLPADRAEWTRGESTEDEREILRRYVEVAARSDIDGMAALLHDDVTLTMPPNPLWFTGRDAMLAFVRPSLDPASPGYLGAWKHLPTRAEITTFEPHLFPAFGLPLTVR
jgi:RNA polymerase sigma-70 factor (ECF subfamily)